MLSQFLDSGVQSHFFADESSFFCQRSYFFGCANHDYIRPDYTHRGWGPKKGNSPEIRKRKLIKYIDTFLHFSFSIHNFVHLDEVAIDVTWHIVQLSLTAFALCTSFREVQELVKMAIISSTLLYKGKNTVRDGGGTALYAAYTVDTFDTFDTVNTVDMDMHFQFSRSE